jgi:hypothetical protein
MTALWLLLALAADGEPARETALVKPRLSFEDALAPYAGHKYKYEGYVGADGKVVNGGLGCSAFTSVVLHRMRDGEDWLKRYDRTVHQWYGDRAAEHFGLKKAGTFGSADLLDERATRALLADGKLTAGQLYLFNARSGKNGHVGFLRPGPDGALEQWHYSSIADGLYRGDFRGWLRASLYRGAQVELYLVPGR